MSECLQQGSEKRQKEFDLPKIAVKRRDSDCPSSTGAQVHFPYLDTYTDSVPFTSSLHTFYPCPI